MQVNAQSEELTAGFAQLEAAQAELEKAQAALQVGRAPASWGSGGFDSASRRTSLYSCLRGCGRLPRCILLHRSGNG